jgi:beta-phosphoglucomutase-like phosphatase (HAD superfamily)
MQHFPRYKTDAILWDYDGTLVNSAPKNIDITKEILSVVAPRLTGENLPRCLESEAAYHIVNHQSKNWQDLYLNYFGMTEAETQQAGALWTPFQLKNATPVNIFPGIEQTIHQLQLPHGICSQNASENINRVLGANHLLEKFIAIVGYTEIPAHVQKPAPEGGIKCLEKMFGTTRDKTILYIGDHEGDVVFARNLENEIRHQNNRVIAITVTYSGASTASWRLKPDVEIATPGELLKIVN